MKAVEGDCEKLLRDGVKLFLMYDFDGVFNALYRGGTFKKEYYSPTHIQRHPNPDYKKKGNEPKSYELAWSEELVKASNVLTASNDVQVVWLTTWRGNMEEVSERLGFTSARTPLYLAWGEQSHEPPLKVDAFKKFFPDFSKVPSETGVVWVDDTELEDKELIYQTIVAPSPNLLLVSPESDYGISREEWKNIEDFAESFSLSA